MLTLAGGPGNFGGRSQVRGVIAARLLTDIVLTLGLAFTPAAAPAAATFSFARAFRSVSRLALLDRRQSMFGTRWTLLLLRTFPRPTLRLLLATRTVLFAAAFPILARRAVVAPFIRAAPAAPPPAPLCARP